jgi:hypothetical protein
VAGQGLTQPAREKPAQVLEGRVAFRARFTQFEKPLLIVSL